uniref:Uncharacterized protein n=1 Tax=Solanum tuberosum TaxID=4113 RepID=M1BA55_SOLTU
MEELELGGSSVEVMYICDDINYSLQMKVGTYHNQMMYLLPIFDLLLVLGHGRYTRESAECSKQCQISLYFGYVFQKYNVDEVSSTGYLITSCPKLQELTIECGVVGIAVESICYTILTSQINLVWCCEAVHYFIGFEMEMEFVKLILASTPALKEIFDG